MKPPESPLATLEKPQQRRQLKRDTQCYQRRGGRIEQLASGRARDLCPVSLNEIEHQFGYYREL